jgi:hypothetical protein
MYHTVSVSFADLHDTPGRMKHKECITKVLPWLGARKFFYWRLRRRLAEHVLRGKIAQADPELSFAQITARIHRWLNEATKAGNGYTDDECVTAWLDSEVTALSCFIPSYPCMCGSLYGCR